MRIFIANTTEQEQLICYRVDFNKDGSPKDAVRRFQPARQQSIKGGSQAQLGGDMHKAQIDAIVEQLGVYGLIHVDDVARMPNRKVPYVYNLDGYVPADIMRRVMFHNGCVLAEDGKQRRAAAAVATNELVQHAVASHFAANKIPEQPTDKTLVAFEQEEQSERGERRVEEGYEVVPEGQRGPRSGKMATSPKVATARRRK
jgi:hypothetical protein